RAGVQHSLRLRQQASGAEPPLAAPSVSALGMAERMLGHSAAALADQRRALAMHERLLGPSHPDLAIDLNNIGLIERDELGDYETARVAFARAYELKRRARGDDSIELGTALMVLADTDLALDRPEQALAHREPPL